MGEGVGEGRGRELPALRTYANIILELDSPRRIELDLLQCLPDDIVRLTLALLGGLDGRGLVEVPVVVDIELAEGIREGEDFALREFGELPERRS